jgi:hypothetical protein
MTDLHIPTPCHENWDAMTPRGDGRHCASCAKTVVDLTALSPAEGRRKLDHIRTQLAADVHVCVRAHADPRGRVVAPANRRRLLTNGLAAVLAMVMAGDHLAAADQVDAAATAASTVTAPVQPATTGLLVAVPTQCIQGDVALPRPPDPPATAPAPVPVPVPPSAVPPQSAVPVAPVEPVRSANPAPMAGDAVRGKDAAPRPPATGPAPGPEPVMGGATIHRPER